MTTSGSGGMHKRNHGTSPARHPGYRDGTHASRSAGGTSASNENRNTMNVPSPVAGGAHSQHGRRLASSPGPSQHVGSSSTSGRGQHGQPDVYNIKTRSPFKDRTVGVCSGPFPTYCAPPAPHGPQTSGRANPSAGVSRPNPNFNMQRCLGGDRKAEVHVNQPGGTCDDVIRPAAQRSPSKAALPTPSDLNSSGGMGASQTFTSGGDISSGPSSPEREEKPAGTAVLDRHHHYLDFSEVNALEPEDHEISQFTTDQLTKRPRRNSFSDMVVDEPPPVTAAALAQQLRVDELSLEEVNLLIQRLEIHKQQLLEREQSLQFVTKQYSHVLNPRRSNGAAILRTLQSLPTSTNRPNGAASARHVRVVHNAPASTMSDPGSRGTGARAPDEKMFSSRINEDSDVSGFPDDMSSVDASAFESTKACAEDDEGSIAIESGCCSPVSLPDSGDHSWVVRRPALKAHSARGVVNGTVDHPRRLQALKKPSTTDLLGPDPTKSIASVQSPRSAFSPRTPRSSASSL